MQKKVVDGFELKKLLKKHISKNKDVSLAVAYWGQNTVDELGLREVEKLRIICNLDHGGTNPAVIKDLMRYANVRMHKQVHAKIGYMDSLSFLGSSNMSENGLSSPLSGGHEEANMVFDGCYKGVQEKFEILWNGSDDVTRQALAKARRDWDWNNNNRVKKLARMFQFKDAYVLTFEETDEEDDKILDDANARAENEFGNRYDVFWGWPEIPHDVSLLCFQETEREGKLNNFSWDDFWRRESKIEDQEYDGNIFQIVRKIRGVGEDDTKVLEAALRKALKAGKLPDKDCDGARCFPFHCLFPHI